MTGKLSICAAKTKAAARPMSGTRRGGQFDAGPAPRGQAEARSRQGGSRQGCFRIQKAVGNVHKSIAVQRDHSGGRNNLHRGNDHPLILPR